MMRKDKITVRVTEDEKSRFKDYCDNINLSPSRELSQHIINVLNYKESHIPISNGRNINILFMNIYNIVNNCECNDKARNELLKLLNELENNI